MARAAGLAQYLRDEFGAQVDVADIKGGKRLEITRGKWWAKIDVHRDHVNWLSLKGPWLKAAHDLVREAFPQFGIKYLIADPFNAKAERELKKHGPWEPVLYHGRPRLRWDL